MIQGIHVHSRGWKKRGCKGRVEVWDKNGKVISAHNTVQEAIDSVLPRKVRSWYRKFIDFLSQDFIHIRRRQ